ncbi:MAG: N-acetylmuramoyl-L-alanine amidase [Clostridia bacterium]|nr:N-acetylmuramoyl-L-alanine amidase [Clostridia bacterium]
MVSKNKSDNEKLSNSINTISVKDQQNNNEMLNSVKEENEIEEKEQEMQPTFVEENKTEEEKTKKNEETVSTIRKTANNKVIVIDPGHQTKGNSEKEPIGPGATETKAKVTGGATGISTGKTEYQLNLEVALKLRDALENEGYTVIMTRTTNDVNLSNSERAQIANEAKAAAFIRIHANSVDSSSVKGVLTMCQTSNNEYNGYLASESYKLSRAVLDNFVKETGAVNKGVTRTDTMSGINWCTVPTTIVEMGFMSNAEEDELMATEEYQNKMVVGMVKGINEFLSE